MVPGHRCEPGCRFPRQRGPRAIGSNVVLHSREPSHTRALAAKLEGLGVKVFTVSGELSDQAQVDAMLDAALTAGGTGRYSL